MTNLAVHTFVHMYPIEIDRLNDILLHTLLGLEIKYFERHVLQRHCTAQAVIEEIPPGLDSQARIVLIRTITNLQARHPCIGGVKK